MTTDLAPTPWTGRDDGPGVEHRRWHHAINETISATSTSDATEPGGVAIIGFQSDEGVRRNKGRTGAANAPAAIRSMLGSLSAPAELRAHDLGDICVSERAMEAGQERLGQTIAGALQKNFLPIVLGGGHETAFGSYLGIAESGALKNRRLGIINLDAHFDLRSEPIPSSGTPFRQIAELHAAAGEDFTYRILGISQANNTLDLFQTASHLGVKHMIDEDCGITNLPAVSDFVDRFLNEIDTVYLTIDLDVLPAHVAPGVSAPAALGIPFEVILAVCRQLARSPKLIHVDIVELNPRFDIDNRTARTAARLIHAIASEHTALLRETLTAPASSPQSGIELL